MNKAAVIILIIFGTYELTVCGINRYSEITVNKLKIKDYNNCVEIDKMLTDMNSIKTTRDEFLDRAIIRRGLIAQNEKLRVKIKDNFDRFKLTSKMSVLIICVLPLFGVHWDQFKYDDSLINPWGTFKELAY